MELEKRHLEKIKEAIRFISTAGGLLSVSV